MNALRWILGLIAAGFVVGFVALTFLGNAFRKSFGASELSPFFIALPVVGMALLLAAIVFQTHKPLLHLAAAAACGLVVFCLWQIFSEGEAPLWYAVAYLAVWFVFYGLAAWRDGTPPTLQRGLGSMPPHG